MVDEYVHTRLDSQEQAQVGQEPDLPPQQKSRVREHLLFHKALITEDEDDDKLDQYMNIVEQLERGMTIAFPNPFDRAIAITFELAIDHHLDPWDIDLITFSSEYLKHVKKDKNLDLVTAGRIILMAWKILKLQSDEVLHNAQQVHEDEQQFWHEPDGDWFLNDDDFEYTTEVINNEDSPLQEMIWRKGKRRVSLIELVGAFEEAKREAEIIRILNDSRAVEREKLKTFRRQNIKTKVHQENLHEDMEIIYKRISKFNGHPIPLSNIHTLELEDRITTLVSSLFLAFNRKINIWQRKFPYGQIFVKNLHNDDEFIETLSATQDEDLKNIVAEQAGELDDDNGGDDKVKIKDIGFANKNKKKKKKKSKPEIEELIVSQKNIAS